MDSFLRKWSRFSLNDVILNCYTRFSSSSQLLTVLQLIIKHWSELEFCVSVHHIMINKNTSLMQLISIYFTFGALALRQHNHYHTQIFYPLDASSASFSGLIPVADMYSIIFSWWSAVSCPKHVETYYKWNTYLLAASSWCSYLSLIWTFYVIHTVHFLVFNTFNNKMLYVRYNRK